MVNTSLGDALKKALGIATVPTIDLSGDADIPIGWSADLQDLYSATERGCSHVRSMPTIIPRDVLAKLRNHPKDKNRFPAVQQRSHLILAAIQAPTLVYAQLYYQEGSNHYRQAFAAQDERIPNCWLLLAVSLARLTGSKTDYHRVITIHRTYAVERSGRERVE